MTTHQNHQNKRQAPTSRPAPSPATSLALLQRLPDEEREVLVLSSFYGLARDEIASVLGASLEFVDSLLARARADLGLLLASGWPKTRAA